MSSSVKFALLAAFALLLVSISVAIQRDTGGIEGVITNQHGPLAKASVEARNVMSGVVFRAESDSAGHYKLEGLPPGRYSLWVKASGHDSEWIRELVVERGRITRHDIHLGISQSGATLPQSKGRLA